MWAVAPGEMLGSKEHARHLEGCEMKLLETTMGGRFCRSGWSFRISSQESSEGEF